MSSAERCDKTVYKVTISPPGWIPARQWQAGVRTDSQKKQEIVDLETKDLAACQLGFILESYVARGRPYGDSTQIRLCREAGLGEIDFKVREGKDYQIVGENKTRIFSKGNYKAYIN